MRQHNGQELLTPGEVARLFGVSPKTVNRWARAGRLTPIMTLGGHRRYRASEVYALLEERSLTDAESHEGDVRNR